MDPGRHPRRRAEERGRLPDRDQHPAPPLLRRAAPADRRTPGGELGRAAGPFVSGTRAAGDPAGVAAAQLTTCLRRANRTSSAVLWRSTFFMISLRGVSTVVPLIARDAANSH